jgi:hypothetical protein
MPTKCESFATIPEGPTKENTKIQISIIVVGLSFKYLGRHLDFGISGIRRQTTLVLKK